MGRQRCVTDAKPTGAGKRKFPDVAPLPPGEPLARLYARGLVAVKSKSLGAHLRQIAAIEAPELGFLASKGGAGHDLAL
jgi:hypothetical protein